MSVANKRFGALVDHLTVDIITSAEQFEGLKREWEELFLSCNNLSVWQSFTWNNLWWKHYGNNLQLSIFTVRENNTLIGIAPFMIRLRFGIREIEPIGGKHHYNFAFIMDIRRDDVVTAIATTLTRYFPNSLVHIPYFMAGTFSIDIFLTALNAENWKEARWTRNISHYISESDGFNNYISSKSKKSRYNLKRERTRLDEKGLVVLKHIRLNDVTEKSLERIAKIQEQSWLARRGQESLASPFYKEVIPALAQNNHAEIFLYEQNGEDIAYVLNFYSGNTCYCFFIGFIESKAPLSPGKMLMMDTLQKVLDRGITVYDYLYGEGEYKLFWANRTRYVCRAVCYKSFRSWILSWFPHRLHGTFSKYHTAKLIVAKIRKLKIKINNHF